MNSAVVKPTSVATRSETIWTDAFVTLFLISLMSHMGFQMSNALLSAYAKGHLGASTVQAGAVFSGFAVSALVFRFVSAPIMDTYNRKHVIIIASLISVVAFLGFAASKSVSSLYFFRLVQGCSLAGSSCTFVMAADVLPRDKYGVGIGYFTLTMVISQAIGPSLGLWLANSFGYPVSFAVFAGLLFLGTLMALRLKVNFKRTKKLEIRLNNLVAKEVLLPSSLLFLLIGGLHFGNSYLVLYAGTRGVESSIGLYFTAGALTSVFARPTLGRLMDKHGTVPVMLPALLCHVVGCFILSFSTTLWHFLAAAVVNALGMAVCQPALQTVSMKKASVNRRGAATSTNMIALDAAALVGPFFGAMAVDAFGYSAMYRIQAVPYFLCGALLFAFRKWFYSTEKGFAQAKEQ